MNASVVYYHFNRTGLSVVESGLKIFRKKRHPQQEYNHLSCRMNLREMQGEKRINT